jgi:hypothetical protein
MTQEERFFGNPFASEHVIPARLYLFGLNLRDSMTQDNPGNVFDDNIGLLTSKLGPLQGEIGDVDVALALQKGSTLTVNGVLKDFRSAMSDNEGFIAVEVGGKNTPAFLEFYPNGLTEYSSATKTKMAMLTSRVFEAATAHSAEIGTPLADELKAFKADWITAQNNQSTKKTSVADNRTERSDARVDVEEACLQGIHRIASVYPFDIEKASSYVKFHLLYPANHHTHTKQSGSTNASGFTMAFNKELTGSMKVKVLNLSDNADLRIGLMPTATAPDLAKPVVKANKSKIFNPAELGNLVNPFLMVGNVSDVNPVLWQVEIIE